MNDTSEKGHQLASILVSVEKVVEFDRLVYEFNNMLPTLRDHIKRIEETNNGIESMCKECGNRMIKIMGVGAYVCLNSHCINHGRAV